MIKRYETGPRLSEAVTYNGMVYLAGQVAEQPTGSVADQTKQTLAEIDKLLRLAGSDKTKILSATIYLTDMSTFAEMNGEWEAWMPKGHAPARATVEAKLADPKYRVEISIVAAQ